MLKKVAKAWKRPKRRSWQTLTKKLQAQPLKIDVQEMTQNQKVYRAAKLIKKINSCVSCMHESMIFWPDAPLPELWSGRKSIPVMWLYMDNSTRCLTYKDQVLTSNE